MRLITPTWMVRHVTEVSPDWLASRGVRALLCDVDNTLVPWRSEAIPPDIRDWVEEMKHAQIALCLVSNTHNGARLARLAKALEVRHVPGNAGKPSRRAFETALRILQAEPWEAAIVGDQLFTDILGGNRHALTTVLVNPLTDYEFVGTKLVSRSLERLVLRGERRRPAA